MAQLIVSAAGAAIGFAVGGPTGAQIGWGLGSLVGSAFAPTQKTQGPRIGDLRVTGTDFGQPIPFIKGSVRTGGQIIWSSDRREIATTTRQGKGGPKVENTTYEYEVDVLYLISENELEGLLRVWENGKLVFTADGLADNDSLVASTSTELWRRITFYGGDGAQLPDPTYEAAVGAGNAPAYRGMCTVFIEGMQLGNSGAIRQFTFEVASKVTAGVYLDYRDRSGRSVPVVAGRYLLDVVDENSAFGSAGLFGVAVATGAEWGLQVGATGQDFSFVGGDFTWRGWGYADSAMSGIGGAIFSTRILVGDSGMYLILDADNALEFSIFSAGAVSSSLMRSTQTGKYLDFDQRFHWAVCRAGTNYSLFLNRELVASMDSPITLSTASAPAQIGSYGIGSPEWIGTLDDVEVSNVARYLPGELGAVSPIPAFDVPTEPTAPDGNTLLLIPFWRVPTVQKAEETLQSVVESLCLRAGLDSSQFDASALATVTKPVRGVALSQVGATRSVMELFGSAYFFQSIVSDKIYFLPRARAVVATIPFKDLGSAPALSNGPEPLALKLMSDIEMPAQEAITYLNIADDYQSDTQFSDRLLSSQTSTSTSSLPMAFMPSEVKAIADAKITDSAISVVSTSLALPREYSHLTPSDSVIVQGEDGSEYRMLLGRMTDQGGVKAFEARLEDATVFTQTGLTAEDYSPQTSVLVAPGTLLYLLDIPLLRDADDEIGIYTLARGLSSGWPGAQVFFSTDNLQFVPSVRHSDTGVAGLCISVLGAWSGGVVFDEINAVTVNVGPATLSSYTADQVLAGEAPLYLVGNELIYAKGAELVSAGVYTLTGLLRGQRGTEQYQSGHIYNERFAVMQLAGMRRLNLSNSDLGALRYFKGATFGRPLSSAPAQTLTLTGASEKPFAPVDARANRTTSDTVISWKRRTRLSTRFLGPLSSSVPLGEASEAYQVEIYTSSAFITVARTLSSTTPSVTYSSANQITDFGSNQSVLYVRIHQISETVGRGFPLQATI